MFWKLWRKSDILERGEVARRVHSQWLSRALASGQSYPRIPIRRVDEGGFSALQGTAYGRHVSEAWWTLALDQVDDAKEGRGGTRG
ncbi:MAG TPA: hypothetical protein VK176_06320 [Phycisphaerales bacterium]|nr:hypothetical protein [Phycisphaerales bacterium]